MILILFIEKIIAIIRRYCNEISIFQRFYKIKKPFHQKRMKWLFSMIYYFIYFSKHKYEMNILLNFLLSNLISNQLKKL